MALKYDQCFKRHVAEWLRSEPRYQSTHFEFCYSSGKLVQVSCSGKLGENISFNNAFKSLFLFINIVSCKRLCLLLKYIALVLMSHNCFNHSFVTAFVKISNSSIQYLFNLTWWNFSITCKVRGVFRTQTNISNGAFLKFLNYFLKKAPS